MNFFCAIVFLLTIQSHKCLFLQWPKYIQFIEVFNGTILIGFLTLPVREFKQHRIFEIAFIGKQDMPKKAILLLSGIPQW